METSSSVCPLSIEALSRFNIACMSFIIILYDGAATHWESRGPRCFKNEAAPILAETDRESQFGFFRL